MFGAVPPGLSHGDCHTQGNSIYWIDACDGSMCGCRKRSDPQGRFARGDRIGVLLDLDAGWMRFFRNGEQCGPGFMEGVTGPLVRAAQLHKTGNAAAVLSGEADSAIAAWAQGYSPYRSPAVGAAADTDDHHCDAAPLKRRRTHIGSEAATSGAAVGGTGRSGGGVVASPAENTRSKRKRDVGAEQKSAPACREDAAAGYEHLLVGVWPPTERVLAVAAARGDVESAASALARPVAGACRLAHKVAAQHWHTAYPKPPAFWHDSPSRPAPGDWPALTIAAWAGHESVVQLLVADGRFDVNVRDCNGVSPLWYAAAGGWVGVVRVLLQHPDLDATAADCEGNSALHIACYHGREGVVRLLLSGGRCEPDGPNAAGVTPLMVAAALNHVRGVVDDGGFSKLAEYECIKRCGGGTCGGGSSPECGCREWCQSKLGGGERLVEFCGRRAKKCQGGVLDALLCSPRVDVNAVAQRGAVEGNTALCIATMTGNAQAVQLLLAHPHVDPAIAGAGYNLQWEQGASAIFFAAQGRRVSHARALVLLLKDGRVDPGLVPERSAENPQISSPLFFAISDMLEDAVSLIAADPRAAAATVRNEAPRQLGLAAVGVASRLARYAGVLRALLEGGHADPNLAGPDGYPPLMLACGAAAAHDVEAGFPCPDNVRLLLADGRADPSCRAPDGNTALHQAIAKGSPDCVRLLLSDGRVDPNARGGPQGLPPLPWACSCPAWSDASAALGVVGLLLADSRCPSTRLRARVDAGLTTPEGCTPLALAVIRGRAPLLRMLLADDRMNPTPREAGKPHLRDLQVLDLACMFALGGEHGAAGERVLQDLSDDPRVDLRATLNGAEAEKERFGLFFPKEYKEEYGGEALVEGEVEDGESRVERRRRALRLLEHGKAEYEWEDRFLARREEQAAMLVDLDFRCEEANRKTAEATASVEKAAAELAAREAALEAAEAALAALGNTSSSEEDEDGGSGGYLDGGLRLNFDDADEV
jgi:ankyrin repeat protein